MIIAKNKKLEGLILVILACLLIAMWNALSVDYQLYDTPFPSENYNGPATNCPPGGGLLDPASAKAVTSRFLYPAPFTFVTREPDELYAIGGAGPITTYIAKVNPTSLKRIKLTYLNLGTARTYPPSVAVHANGHIYVTAQNVCYKLDNDINIINHYVLPIKESEDIYNSVKVLSDGNVICKGIANPQEPNGYSSITLLDPDLNPVIPELLLPEKSYGRVSVHIHDSREYVYFTGETTLIRYEYIPGANHPLVKDETWSYKYRTGTSVVQTPGGIASFIGDNAFFADNAASVPIKPLGPINLHRVNLYDSSDAQIFTPFGLPRGYRFNKNLVDPVNEIIVMGDSTNHKLGAYRYLGNRQYEELWVKDYKSGIMLSASSSTKQLYVTDFDSLKRCDNVIILNTETGEELKRIQTPSKSESTGGVALGWNNDIFVTTGFTSVRVHNDDLSRRQKRFRAPSGVIADSRTKSGEIASKLYANFPNPLNPETWIPYSLDTGALVSIDIYDLQGVCIRRLDLGYRSAGIYTSKSEAAYWDGRNESGEEVPSGVYFYSIRARDFEATRRMIVLR